MVLLVFLLDTSASMNQRTCLGTTYLDLAKGAVESFLKIRARDSNVSRGDRYMLVSYDDLTKSVKAGWRENLVTFMKELKNLEGNGMSNIGRALRDTFDLLNMHRLQSGIDNYGMGRNPYYLEPALILMFTDGCAGMDLEGMIPEITYPTHNLPPGAELTKEMYRWDQRLFTLNIKIPGFASSVSENLTVMQPEDHPLGTLCEQTGGKLYNVVSQKTFMQSMESVAQKILIPGVSISFEKYGSDPEPIPNQNDDLSDPHSALIKNEPPILNGFIPPPMFDPKLTNGSFSMPNDVSKVPNGLLNNAPPGLLPSPLMMPMMPPLPNMMPGGPGGPRGMIPPPGGFPGLLRPPMPPYAPQNKLLSPISNEMTPPPMLPLVNGKVDKSELCGSKEIKSEGEDTKGSKIPDIPVRGDESTADCNGSMNPITASTTWHIQNRMIYVKTNVKGTVGHWPIPEGFWPDSSDSKLQPRDSHPIVNFVCSSTEAMAIDNMPFDKYELEPSPLTQYILERKQPNVAWQTFVNGSSQNSELGFPFGYLKASTNLQCVNFFVLPYNYTCIMPLLDELFKIHKCKPTPKWRQMFDDYLKTIPTYYAAPLRNALRRMGAPPNLVPDHMDGAMSYSVVSYLKKIKHQAKLEAERLTTLHSRTHIPEPVKVNIPSSPAFFDGKALDFKKLLIQKSTALLNKDIDSKNQSKHKSNRDIEPFKPFVDVGLPVLVDKFQVRGYKNPFDISRNDILNQTARMRTNFFHIDSVCNRLHEEDTKHRVSIVEMGNYQEHVIQNKPLREVDPSQVRVHTFGNPWKLKQDQIIAVDEADVNDNMAFGGIKKRAGDAAPIPLKNKKRRNDTPPPSRRPLGPPNTPPPKLIQPEINALESSIRQDEFNFPLKHNENIISEEKSIVLPINNDNDSSKISKHTNNMNEQLRKLQQFHKSGKEFSENRNDLYNNDNSDSLASPILSILQTSLEELDDKENEELVMINENDIAVNHNEAVLNNDSYSKSSTSSPASKQMPNHTPTLTVRKARLQLQSQSCTKIRLGIWQAIRSQAEFKVILGLLEQLTVSKMAKNIFIADIIAEADRFQLTSLIENLRGLLSPVNNKMDHGESFLIF